MLLLSVLVLVCYTWNLGAAPLTESSEARYAEIPLEMAQTGDYLTPRYNSIAHLHKPPFFYWTVAASYKVFGVSELSARVPPMIAGIVTILLTGWIASVEFRRPREEGVLAALLLASSPFFWELSRICMTDMLVTLLTTLSIAAFQRLSREPTNRLAFFIFWSALGLNFLTKGPVGLMLVGLVVVPYTWKKKLGFAKTLYPLLGLPLASIIALPWYLWAVNAYPGLLAYFLKFQTADRVLTTTHSRTGPIWLYLVIILAGTLPWTAWLVKGWIGVARDKAWNDNNVFLALWILPAFLIFSLMGSKLPAYILPLFPPLAIFTAGNLTRLRTKDFYWPFTLYLIIGFAAVLQIQFQIIPDIEHYHTNLMWTSALFLTGSTFLLIWSQGHRQRLLVGALLLGFSLQFAAGSSYQKLAPHTAKPVADAILHEADGEYEVAMYGGYLFGLPFYLDRSIIHVKYDRETQFETTNSISKLMLPDLASYLPRFRRGDLERFLVISTEDWPTVEALFTAEVFFKDAQYVVVRQAALPSNRLPLVKPPTTSSTNQ